MERNSGLFSEATYGFYLIDFWNQAISFWVISHFLDKTQSKPVQLWTLDAAHMFFFCYEQQHTDVLCVDFLSQALMQCTQKWMYSLCNSLIAEDQAIIN